MSTPPNDDDGTILARFYAYAIRVQEDQQIIHLQAKQRLQIAETQAMSLLEVISPKQHPIAIHAVLQSHHQYAHQVYEDQQIIYLQSKRRLEEAQGVVHALALKIQAQSKKQQGPPDPAEESAKPTTPTVTTDTDRRTELPDLAKESATPTDKRTEPTEAVSSKPTKPASKKVASMKPTTSLKSSEPTESNKRGPGRPRKSDAKRNSPEESLRDAPRGPGRPRKLESKSDPIEKPLLDDATGDQAPKALSNEMTTINTPQKKISGKSSKKSSRRKTAFNGSFVELDEEDILTDPEDVIPKYGHKGSAASSKMGAAPEQEVSVQDGDYDDDEGSQVSQQEGAEGSKQDTKKRRRQKSLIPKNLKRKKRPQSIEEVVADGLAKAAEEEMRAVSLTQEKTVEERHTEALRVKEIMAFELGG
jgi:hypothetical protein